MASDVRGILRTLRKHGYTVKQHGGNHYKVYEGRRLVYVLPTTPGGGRWRQNAMADLRRLTSITKG
jgi:hypothetical protein